MTRWSTKKLLRVFRLEKLFLSIRAKQQAGLSGINWQGARFRQIDNLDSA